MQTLQNESQSEVYRSSWHTYAMFFLSEISEHGCVHQLCTSMFEVEMIFSASWLCKICKLEWRKVESSSGFACFCFLFFVLICFAMLILPHVSTEVVR